MQASTSYGIACLFGRSSPGRCARDGEAAIEIDAALPPEPGEPGVVTVTEYAQGPGSQDGGGAGGILQKVLRLVKRIPEAVAAGLRLLANDPAELALLAGVWALLWAPCYLGDRRRSLRGVRAHRLTSRGAT